MTDIDQKMIFIVGNSRSGTTMLGRIMGLNTKIHTFGELHFFEQLISAEAFRENPTWSSEQAQPVLERLLTRIRDGFFAPFRPGKFGAAAQEVVENASSQTPAALYATTLLREVQRKGKVIPCEQTPRYLFSAQEILATYPNAYIINMVRDPRDVLLSQRSKWKRRFLGAKNIPLSEAFRAWCNYHPWLVTRLWVSCVSYAAAIEHDRFRSVRFEDLLLDPDGEIRRLCDFIGVAFEDQMLNTPQIGSSSGNDHPERKGLNKDRVAAWKTQGLSSGTRALCENVARSQMKRWGYTDLLNEGRLTAGALVPLIFLPFKLALGVLVNLRRFPNLFSSLSRRLTSGQSVQ